MSLDYAYDVEYRKKNKEKIRAYKRAWRQRADVKAANMERNRTSPKRAAWEFIRSRVWKGKLKRGNCVFCGEPNAHAHHEDYNKLREVVWVCVRHHADIHRGVLKVLPEHIYHVEC